MTPVCRQSGTQRESTHLPGLTRRNAQIAEYEISIQVDISRRV
jgi:hypothetical protein